MVAIALLQLTLVAFLLFQQSALALLLSEVVVVIVLVLSGVGESWLIQLMLILGVMFMASTLSKWRPRNRASPAAGVQSADADHDVLEPSDRSLGDANSRSHHSDDGHQTQARTAGVVKIILFFAQTVATVVQPAAWPSWTRHAVHQLEALNVHLSGLECFLPSGENQPVWKFLTQLALPWVLALNMIVAACAAALAIKMGLADAAQRCGAMLLNFRICCRAKSGREEDPLLADRTEARSRSAITPSLRISSLVRRVQFSILFLLSASYFELSNLILAIIRPCENSYMASFQWIPCDSSGGAFHPAFVALLSCGIVFFVLYTIGIPAFFSWIMFRHRKTLSKVQHDPPTLNAVPAVSNAKEIEAKYGFLFEAYKTRWFWWEMMWFLRRILLSIAVATLRSYDGYQLAFISIVMFGFMFLHRFVKPFASQAANVLDLVASAVILLSLSISSQISHISGESATMTVVLQNLVFLAASSVLLVLVGFLLLPLAASIKSCVSKKR